MALGCVWPAASLACTADALLLERVHECISADAGSQLPFQTDREVAGLDQSGTFCAVVVWTEVFEGRTALDALSNSHEQTR